MVKENLKYVTAINTTHDIREYYVCFDKEIVTESICRGGNKWCNYTYKLIDFVSGDNFDIIKDAINQKRPL
jgi:hypothetical protein